MTNNEHIDIRPFLDEQPSGASHWRAFGLGFFIVAGNHLQMASHA